MTAIRNRLLVVCDDPFTLTLLKICLQGSRFRLMHLTPGTPLPESGSFDLLLLDLPEPERNGSAFWRKIRNAAPDVPMLILHALAGPGKNRLEQEIARERRICLLDRGLMPEVLEKVLLQLLSGVPRSLIENNLPRRLFAPAPPETPQELPWCRLDPAMLLSVFSRPAGQTGGDACEMLQLSFGRWLFFMGDLAGHGDPAARSMHLVLAHLRELVRRGESGCEPHLLLTALNDFFRRTFPAGQSMTCVIALIDFLHCRIRCQSAGHPPLIGYSPGSGRLLHPGARETADDIPIGWQPNHRYRKSATTETAFSPDTVFFGFTDGLLERMDHRQHSPAADLSPALLKTVRNAPGAAAFPFRLHQTMEQLGYRTIRDDITIAAFCKNELSPEELHFVIRPRSGDCGDAVEEFVTARTGDELLGFKAGLLVHEFVTNILLHGLKREKDSCSCTVYLHVKVAPEYLHLEVLDRGCEWDRSLLQQKEFDFFQRRNGRLASSGRGIALIASLASRITSVRCAELNDTVFYLLRNSNQKGTQA